MNRRELLKKAGFLTTSVAVFGVAGCNSNDHDSQPAIHSKPSIKLAYQFPQGVMAADPKPESIILWTRVVTPTDDMIAQIPASRADVDLSLELSASTSFATLLTPPINLKAKATYDNTIRHKLTGLTPASTYYYRFRAGSGVSRVGSFKTAPAATTDNTELKFAFMACQDWSVNHWVGMSALAEMDVDFIVHLGDYIYEAAGDSYQTETVEATHDKLKIPSNTSNPKNAAAKVATTTEDYRYLYKKYRTDPRLQALHAKCAFIAIWDDHEFSDDCWQNNETYTNGSITVVNGVLPVSPAQLGGTDTTSQTQRRRSANRAWFEFMPADIPALDEGAADNFKTVKIYRDLQFGKLAHFVMTDERLYRADHVIPEAVDNPTTPTPDQLGSIGSRYFVPEPTFAQVQGGKMQAALKTAFDSLPATDANKAVLGGILLKLQTDPSGASLTASEQAVFGEVGLPLVSILGESQRNWWKDKMKTSAATWKFWGNEVSLLRMALNLNALPAVVAQAEGDPVLSALLNSYLINADQWDGYSAERANLTGFLAANNIKNVVAITGDIHAFFAGEVAANYGAYVEGNAALVDLVAAGVSSSSFWSYLASVVGDFEAEVTAIKDQRTMTPTSYLNQLESGANPFANLRQLVYTSANILKYQGVKTAVMATAPDASSPEKKQAVDRLIFEEFLKQEVPTAAGGYLPINTLNETLAGDMGTIIQGLASLPINPYTGTATAPAKQNPWLKYVETKTQGFITVRVTPAKVEAKFHHTASLAASPTAANVVTKVKTVTVNSGSTALTVS